VASEVIGEALDGDERLVEHPPRRQRRLCGEGRELLETPAYGLRLSQQSGSPPDLRGGALTAAS